MRMCCCVLAILVAAPLIAASTTAPERPADACMIPPLDVFTVDGNPGKWTVGGVERGFRIDVLGEATQHPACDANPAPSVRLAWTPRGLAALIRVHDTTPTESDRAESLWEKDSVELMVSDSAHPRQLIQFVITPGMEPAHPQLRSHLHDHRADKSNPQTPAIEAASAKTSDGYLVEALIPWTDLQLTPAIGTRLGIQVKVNDALLTGQRICYRWRPTDAAYNNAAFHQPLILADTASDPVSFAASGDYQAFRRYRVRINSTGNSRRKIVLQDDGGRELAAIAHAGGRAHIDLPFPTGPGLGAITVLADGKPVTRFTPDPPASRSEALDQLKIRCSGFAFSGTAFPAIDFEDPIAAEDILGDYTVTTRYFEARLNEVVSAEAPGRYAAALHIAGAGGLVADRIYTLYRFPADVGRRDALEFAGKDLALPREFGITPAVATRQSAALFGALNRTLFNDLARSDDGAILLAGLAETPADAPAFVSRTDPSSINSIYIHALKKKLGLATSYPYLEYLPPDYATAKGARFPLVIFLHGSGERGDELNIVKRVGLPVYLASHPEFPAVVLCPQCPRGAVWKPAEINELITQALAKYRIDPDRIYMTGVSMGGFCTWSYATWYPQRLAAIVPVCGIGDPKDMVRLKSVPTWAFHGEVDPVVPIGRDRECVDALSAAGGDVQFTTYPGVGHRCENLAYNTPALYTWLFAQVRKPTGPPATRPGP